MILLLDNYDSFTYNLFQYLSELGADVLVKRNDELSVGDVAALAPAKIVISPGPCTPNEAGISVALIRELGGRVPILGVCLGHQAIGAAYGGAVTPLATKKPFPVFIDETAELWPLVGISGGLRGLEILLAPADLIRVTGARLADIARQL